MSTQHDERRRLIDLFRETGEVAFLRAAICLERGSRIVDRADIEIADERAIGRPRDDDFDALLRVAERIVADPRRSDWSACLEAACGIGGHSVEATAKRLFRKFRERRGELLALAIRLHEIRRSSPAALVDKINRSSPIALLTRAFHKKAGI